MTHPKHLFLYTLIAFLLFSFSSLAQTNSPAATYITNNTGYAGGATNGNCVAYDASGNMYVAGVFTGEMNADPTGTTTTYKLTAVGVTTDIYVAKYSSTGSLVWAFSLGGSSADVARGITVDANGYIYLVGNITAASSTNIDADPSSNTNNISGASVSNSSDIFIAKYNGNTTPSNTTFYKWAFTAGSTSTDQANAVTVDAAGNVYVCGTIAGTTAMDMDPSSNTNNITGAGGNDMFVAKYDGTLTPSSTSFYKWAFQVGASGADAMLGMAIDASGYIYTCGTINGSTSTNIDADPTSNTNYVTGVAVTSSADVFVAKYDGTLDPSNTSFYKWAFTTGSTSADQANAITTDATGNVYIGGLISGTTALDADPSANSNTVTGAGGSDIFIAKYDGTLAPASTSFYKWAFVTGNTGTDQALAIKVDASNKLIVAGTVSISSSLSVDADPSSNTNNVTNGYSTSSQDFFLAKYDATLDPTSTSFYQWAFAAGGTGTDLFNGVAASSSKIYVAGNIGSTTSVGSFDADPSSNTNNITGSGSITGAAMIYDNTVTATSTSFYKAALAIGYATGSSNVANSTAMDASGNTYAVGGYAGTIVLGSGSNTVTLTSSLGTTDGYLAKYDVGGSLLWAFSLGSNGGTDQLLAVTVDASGYVYVAGQMTGTDATSFDADPSSNTNNVSGATTTSTTDMFIAKYDGSLTPSSTSFYKWAFVIGSNNSGTEQVNAITVDASGYVYIAGQASGSTSTTFDADPSSNTNNIAGSSSSTSVDWFVAKYDGTLAPSSTSFYKWAFTIGVSAGTGTDVLNNIAVDGSGNVYVGGEFLATTSFSIDADPSSGSHTFPGLTGSASDEILIAKYDGTLTPSSTSFYKWAFSFGSNGADDIYNIKLDGSNLYVAGNITGTTGTNIDADPSSGTHNVTGATGSSTTDMFVAKYDVSLDPTNTSFYKWAFTMGASVGTDRIKSIAVDGSGYVYVGGTMTGTTSTSFDADPSTNATNVTALSTGSSSTDLFLAKYDGSLDPTSTSFFQWAGTAGGNNPEQLNSIAYSSSRIAAAGAFTGAVSLQPGSTGTTNTSSQNGSVQSLYVANFIDAITWTGGTSTDWNTGSNWVGSAVPGSTDNAFIPSSGVTNEPNVGANSSINTLIVSSNRTLTIASSKKLSVSGSFVNSGTVDGSGALSLTGTSLQRISGTNTVNNLELNNTSGATISSGTVNIIDTYTPTSGILTTGGNLVLKSTASGTGRIAAGSGSGGYISGNVTLERYIPAKRAFRFMAHPFTSSLSMSALTDDIDITGSGGSPFTATSTNNPSAFYFDVTTGDNSTTGNNPGWAGYTASSSWAQYQAMRVLVRGAKGEGLNYPLVPYTPSATTIDLIGAVNQGDVNMSLTKGSSTNFVLVGNPFPSQVNMDALTTTNVGSSFYIWDATQGTKGGYTSYSFGSSSFNLPSGGAFCTTLSANGSIVFEEADKTSGTAGTMFKTTAIANTVQLRLEDSTIFWDRLLLRFDDNAMATVDYPDAPKLYNPDMSFYTWSKDDSMLSIDTRPYKDSSIIPLGLYSTLKKNFKILVSDFNVPAGTHLFLHDKYLKKTEEILQGYEYWFTVTSDTASWGNNRFELNTQGKPTGIISSDTASNTLKVKLVPNPVNDKLTVFTEGTNGTTYIIITNMIGVKVAEQQASGNTIIIPLYGIANGIYMVTISNGNNSITQKLIKQ